MVNNGILIHNIEITQKLHTSSVPNVLVFDPGRTTCPAAELVVQLRRTVCPTVQRTNRLYTPDNSSGLFGMYDSVMFLYGYFICISRVGQVVRLPYGNSVPVLAVYDDIVRVVRCMRTTRPPYYTCRPTPIKHKYIRNGGSSKSSYFFATVTPCEGDAGEGSLLTIMPYFL